MPSPYHPRSFRGFRQLSSRSLPDRYISLPFSQLAGCGYPVASEALTPAIDAGSAQVVPKR